MFNKRQEEAGIILIHLSKSVKITNYNCLMDMDLRKAQHFLQYLQ